MANNILSTVELIERANAILSKHSKNLDQAAVSLNKYVNSAKLPSDFVTSLKTIEKTEKNTLKTSKQLEAQQRKMLRERVQELKMHKKRERAMDKYERQLKREERSLARSQGLYNRIQRGVTSVSRAYNDLAAKKALDGKLSKEQEIQLSRLEAKLQKYQGVLKKVDSNIGKYNRNVGNYASGWNGLGNSINQLTREAPAFANSIQTGFMALSNNIPILTDEIGRLVAANKALQAEGKPTISVFRQIMKSVFSLQTAMSIGITLLVLYGKEIGEWAKSVMGAGSAADRMAENTKKINEESAKLSSQTIPQFQALVKIATDVTESEVRRADAIKELNEQYPDFNANILEESDNTDLVNDAIDAYIIKLGQKAKAQASMNLIQEKYNELILIEQEREELRQRIFDKANENRKLNNKELFKTQEEAIAFYQKTSDALDENAQGQRRSQQASNLFGTALDSLNDKNSELADKQDEINQLMEVYIENVDLSSKKSSELTEGTREQTEALSVELGVVKFMRLEVEKQIAVYEAMAKKYVEGSRLSKEYTERVRQLKIVLGEISTTSLIDASQALDEAARHFRNNPPSADISPPDNAPDDWRDTFRSITDVARRAFGIITALSDASFEKQFSDLQRQKEIAIQFAGESATAREDIERQYAEKQKQIQREQAKAKKEQAIFNIVVDTAGAVVQALPNVVLASIIGALGAAQLALVTSQQIPQFWQGGEVGGNQRIMVNDDPFGKKGSNYKEVVEKPNGQLLTPKGKNVKMTVPKGSIVHPTYDAFINSLDSELLGNNIMPIGQSNIMPMIINEGLTRSDIMDVMNNHGKSVVNAINNKESFVFNYDERGAEILKRKKGATHKIMNARYSGKGIGV